MANTQITPPRVPLGYVVDKDNNRLPVQIERPWYLFLYEMFNRVGGGTSSTTITEVTASVTELTSDTDVALAFMPSSPTNKTADPAVANDVICYQVFGA